MALLEFEETRGWSSSDSDGSDMLDGEREEVPLIRTGFQTPSKGSSNPSCDSEEINEEPYDIDLSNADIKKRIVDRSHVFAK